MVISTSHEIDWLVSDHNFKLQVYYSRDWNMYSTGVGKNKMIDKKSLKIPKGSSKSVYHRQTYSTIAKRKNTKGQTTIYKIYP
jgi:hypothetical protein